MPSTDDDEAYARMLQQQILDEGREEADAELARRLQEMEGRGVLTESASNRIKRQEEEDARLARMLAEAGGSFKDLNLQHISAERYPCNSPPSQPLETDRSPLDRKDVRTTDTCLTTFVEHSLSHESSQSAASSENSRRRMNAYKTNSGDNRPTAPHGPIDPWKVHMDRPNPKSDLDAVGVDPDSILASNGTILDIRQDPKKIKPNKLATGFMKNLFRGPSKSPKRDRPGTQPSKTNSPSQIMSRKSSDSSEPSSKPDISDIYAAGGNPAVRFPLPDPELHPAETIEAAKWPLPFSFSVQSDAQVFRETNNKTKSSKSPWLSKATAVCSVCSHHVQNPLNAFDLQYHKECFRCVTCHEIIDPSVPFAFVESAGQKQPMHRNCYTEIFGIRCCVCEKMIPAGPSGNVSFLKHPFFETERMCSIHARNQTRRCTGCHRFEPEKEPFADLNDAGRCVCLSCCRSVIVDSQDAQPLWDKVIEFFDKKLKLPVWRDFRRIPILVVGYEALNEQMGNSSNPHKESAQIMTRGLCLTEHESGKRLRLNRQRYDNDSQSFIPADAEERGFTIIRVPDANKVNPSTSVTGILCLSGLPRDLAASVLAHEATHAWIRMHPRFDFEKPIPLQVEEGCAQLIAFLFLNDGLDKPTPPDSNDMVEPSDEKLRHYFKFSIETEENEIYGTGFRRAAKAYSHIGIEALMSHVVLYQNFPET